jgi:iron complex outermembrane receptor protein
LNYKSPTTIGNSNLEPEKAFSQEVGLKWNTSNFNLSAVFNRNSSHLIDYVKWSLRILGKRKTFKMLPPGFETQLLYSFNLNAFAQSYNLVILLFRMI